MRLAGLQFKQLIPATVLGQFEFDAHPVGHGFSLDSSYCHCQIAAISIGTNSHKTLSVMLLPFVYIIWILRKQYQVCYFVFLQRFLQGFSLVKNISERFEIGDWWEKNGTVWSNLGGCYCVFAKRPQPESMNHVRPITILSCLYGLTSKVLADQIGNHLSSVMPLPVSGGRRGVKDLAFLQKLAIEETLVSDTHLCGFSLDLVRAFNPFPRLPLSIILQKMGVPSSTCTFWWNHYRDL